MFILLNFSNIKDNEESKINEGGISFQTSNKIKVNNEKNYQVFSINADYNFNTYKGIKADVGTKLSNINSNGTSSFLDEINNLENKELNEIEDMIFAGFFSLTKEYEKLSINCGLRTETTKSMVFLNNSSIINNTYTYFFPSFLIDYSFSDNFKTTLSYSKKISRPLFSEINPTYFYIDSLSYRVGNPLLKSTFSDNFSLNLSIFKDINFSVDFSHFIDDRMFVVLNDNINPNKLKLTTINIPLSNQLNLGLAYNYSEGKISCYSSGGISFPFLEIPYLNEMQKVRQPVWYIDINNDYNISKCFIFNCGFNYQSKGPSQSTFFKESYNLSAGISAKLLKKQLKISIVVNDILKTSDQVWYVKYGNIESGQNPNYDNQYIKISIKYIFNNFKSVFEKRSGNQDELNRL